MPYLSDFEHTKFDAQISPGLVKQTRYVSDSTNGHRRVPMVQEWKVDRLLAKGGFGEVRLEVCVEEKKRRAVKRIWATGSTFKIQYERELKALLEFSKPKYKESAAFVEFYGWFQDLESVYIAMEYIPLGDLEENVALLGGTLREAEVRDITVQVLEGLKIMHLESFVHRDLKPKNILVCHGPPRWWVKLADFGLSKHRTTDTAFRTRTGTQAYMAPEILNYITGVDPDTSEYTEAVDMWALGCIVYRLTSGVVPFPPGTSLVAFCGDESRFPAKGFIMGELGSQFVRSLLLPYPSRRLNAQKALEHAWTKATFRSSSPSNILEEVDANEPGLNDKPFAGVYNTATHAGLQSYANSPSIQPANLAYIENKPKFTYHPSAVGDPEKQTKRYHHSSGEKIPGQVPTNSGLLSRGAAPIGGQDNKVTIMKGPLRSMYSQLHEPLESRKLKYTAEAGPQAKDIGSTFKLNGSLQKSQRALTRQHQKISFHLPDAERSHELYEDGPPDEKAKLAIDNVASSSQSPNASPNKAQIRNCTVTPPGHGAKHFTGQKDRPRQMRPYPTEFSTPQRREFYPFKTPELENIDSSSDSESRYSSPRYSINPRPKWIEARGPTKWNFVVEGGRTVPLLGKPRRTPGRPPLIPSPRPGKQRRSEYNISSDFYNAADGPEPIIYAARPNLSRKASSHDVSRWSPLPLSDPRPRVDDPYYPAVPKAPGPYVQMVYANVYGAQYPRPGATAYDRAYEDDHRGW